MVLLIGTTVFPDLLHCVDFKKDFHRMKIGTELVFQIFPAILSLITVTVVSAYVLNLRIRLSREIQPLVNLPTETVNCIQIQSVEHTAETFQQITSRDEQRRRPNWNDVQIMDIDNRDQEDLPNIKSVNKENVQEEESSFYIKRSNSDPNQFFRVPKETKLPEVKTPSCFSPLSLIVERIMMINIAAFCVVLNLTLSTSMRLLAFYFFREGRETYARFTVLRTWVSLVNYLIIIIYVLVIRRKLCKH